ncbi:unnamed protein product [Peniophora sp. CBMAI 1063]|nr:unnamed protein product [Peniophora sp. CBMAI 1063]
MGLLAGVQASRAAQAPLVDSVEWDVEPDIDATGRFVFNSVSSLMQLWPNTVVRPGHSIVPCLIPTGTVLYHGRSSSSIPDAPDWIAFDFEHSYFFTRGDEGHVFTFSTTRPLKLLYFDGSSAAKVDDGSLDSQDVLLYGEAGGGVDGDAERIVKLCEWGRPRGIDGFVRMEAHFEVMQCNFTDGLKLLSTHKVLPHIESPNLRNPALGNLTGTHGHAQQYHLEPPHRVPRPPPGWRGSLPTDIAGEIYVVGKWHDFAPGETRVKLLYHKLVSFYDPAISSLIAARRGKPREHHRLKGISRTDAATKIKEIEEMVGSDWNDVGRSGVDWASTTHVVVERYAQRLEVLAHTLRPAPYSDIRERAAKAHAQVLTMLASHFTVSDVPEDDSAATSKAWLAPVVRRCASTHTAGIPTALLTPQERLIHGAIEDVMREICRRLGRMFHAAFTVEDPDIPEEDVYAVVDSMKTEVDALMEWLDWTQAWVKCNPGCDMEEMCYVPTWPFGPDEDPEGTRRPSCIWSCYVTVVLPQVRDLLRI